MCCDPRTGIFFACIMCVTWRGFGQSPQTCPPQESCPASSKPREQQKQKQQQRSKSTISRGKCTVHRELRAAIDDTNLIASIQRISSRSAAISNSSQRSAMVNAMRTQLQSQSLTCLFGLLSLLCLHPGEAQRLPPNNCDNLFHYQRQADRWIGHVTPTQNGLKSVDWKLTFVAHGVNLVSKKEKEGEREGESVWGKCSMFGYFRLAPLAT